MPNRKFSAGSSYRYSINGQEKSDEIDANFTTAQYWEYDSRTGRRWNLDPKPTIGLSSYATFSNNPISLSDISGDTLGGIDEKSATRQLSAIQNSFAGNDKKDLRDLFKLDQNNCTDFTQINQKDFLNAIKGQSDDIQALAYGYYSEINSATRNTVEIINREENYSPQAVSIINSDEYVTSGKYKPSGTGVDFDYLKGGGVNKGTFVGTKFTGTYSVLIANSTAAISDYQQSATAGTAMSLNSSLEELSAHEGIGHGLGRGVSSTYGHEDAIQMTNLYRRISTPIPLLPPWRNGKQHGTGNVIPYNQANVIPAYLQLGLFMFKLSNSWRNIGL